jgi:hypothetical protein
MRSASAFSTNLNPVVEIVDSIERILGLGRVLAMSIS